MIAYRIIVRDKFKEYKMNEDYWWPMLHFGPVNLWTVMDAHSFYSSREEQEERIWRKYTGERKRARITKIMPVNSPALGRITALIECR